MSRKTLAKQVYLCVRMYLSDSLSTCECICMSMYIYEYLKETANKIHICMYECNIELEVWAPYVYVNM